MDQPFKQLNPAKTTERGHYPITCGAAATFADQHEQDSAEQANLDKRITEFRYCHEEAIRPRRSKRLEKVVDCLIGEHQRILGQDVLHNPQEPPPGRKKRQGQKAEENFLPLLVKEKVGENPFCRTHDPMGRNLRARS